MLCEFELGRMMKDIPVVDARLSEARLARPREPWELVAVFPKVTEAGTFDEAGGERRQVGMLCQKFVVELTGISESEDAVELAFSQLLELARDVADTIWAAQQTQGFAGSDPKIVRHELEIDGSTSEFHLASRHGMGAMYVGLPMPSYDDLRRAAEEGVRPSVAQLLLAQATRWGLAEHFASKSAALLLAASACEVAIKSVLSSDPHGNLGTLAGVLDPEGRQAPVSPATLLEHAVPVALGRSINDDLPGVVKRYKGLTKMRDSVIHTGAQISQAELHPHLNVAREVVGWVEDRLAEA